MAGDVCPVCGEDREQLVNRCVARVHRSQEEFVSLALLLLRIKYPDGAPWEKGDSLAIYAELGWLRERLGFLPPLALETALMEQIRRLR